VAHLQANIFRT